MDENENKEVLEGQIVNEAEVNGIKISDDVVVERTPACSRIRLLESDARV